MSEDKDMLSATGLLKRRLIIIAVVLLVFGGFCAAFAYRYRKPRPHTEQEIRDVTSLIQQHTSETISSMKRHRDGSVEAETRKAGYGGQIFHLSRGVNGWQIASSVPYIE